MQSATTFGTGAVAIGITVDDSERVRIATDDPNHLVQLSCVVAGTGEEAFGGVSYGGAQGGVPAPGQYNVVVQSGGPGTVFVEPIPPLPEV